MSQGPNKLFDEVAKLMTDAAGAAQGVKREAETVFRSQAEKFLSDMDLVKRDEFEAVREMAANARAQNEILQTRIEELEAKLTKKPATKSGAAAKTTRAKASSTKKS